MTTHSPHPPRPDTTDPERLAELDSLCILDTGPEEGFDDVVELARQLCDAPVALVSFVAADRQWFKARAGFPPQETDLDRSVCAYALYENDLLVIPDLSVDPRTKRNPLVTHDPFIRFYAGAPLRMPSGRVMGSLCVIDRVARPDGLTDAQAEALRRLARQVMTLLRERAQVSKLQAAEAVASASARRSTALVALADALRDATGIDQAVRVAADIVSQTLAADGAGFAELDATGEFFSVVRPDPVEGLVTQRHRLSAFGSLGEEIGRGRPVMIADMLADERLGPMGEKVARTGVRSMLNVPIQERGRTAGLVYVQSAEPRIWQDEEADFARNVADRLQSAVARLRAEAHQETLNRELSHRMKNLLAMVQAIAAQTLRRAGSVEAAREALSQRLFAMGEAHDLLLGGKGEATTLDAVVRNALRVHEDGRPGRLAISGPAVVVGEKSAMSVVLMMHELATNALKYGALSVAEGRVEIDWVLEEQDGEAMVRLTWAERQGPAVVPPRQRGFGSTLIERGAAGAVGGQVVLDFAPQGVRCQMIVPLARLEAAD